MRPRVLFLSHEDGRGIGGSTYSLYHLIKSVEGCIDYVVITRRGDAFEYLRSKGIKCVLTTKPLRLQVWFRSRAKLKILECAVRVVYNYTANFFTALYISRKFKGRVDIVHTNSAVLDVGFTLAKMLKAKHVWHLREFLNLDHDMEPLLGWPRVIKLCQKADAVVAISDAVAKHYNVMNRNSTIHDAICGGGEMPPTLAREKYFLYAGGSKKKKGIFDAIRVFNRLSSKYPDYKLLLAGNFNPEETSILRSEIQINRNIQILGARKDINILMAKATALLMCSHNEGLGRVTIEAFFAGCPVVGKAAGATVEIITKGVTGWLYNNDEEFQDCLLEVIENTELVNQIVENARLFAERNFTEDVYGRKIKKLYFSLLNEKLI